MPLSKQSTQKMENFLFLVIKDNNLIHIISHLCHYLPSLSLSWRSETQIININDWAQKSSHWQQRKLSLHGYYKRPINIIHHGTTFSCHDYFPKAEEYNWLRKTLSISLNGLLWNAVSAFSNMFYPNKAKCTTLLKENVIASHFISIFLCFIS